MTGKRSLYHLLNALIAAVWLVNGLLCKVLNLVPRHEQIVAEILGTEYARILTVLIGLAEIVMAIWILSRWHSRLNAILQMVVVGLMNVLEFLMVPSLLLWGRANIIFAILFIALVYYHEFILKKIKDA